MRHLGAGKLSEAEGLYLQILKTNPDHPVALHLLGVITHQSGNHDKAVDLITKAVTVKPDYADAHYNLGNTLKALGRLEEAMVSYEKALAIKPDFAEAHSNLGNTFRDLGQLDDAVESYRKALALRPDDADVRYNLGNTLKALKRLDEAVESYEKALAIMPGYADAHGNLGNTLMELGRLDEAVESYAKALDIMPGYAEAHFNLANTLKDLERLDEAVESYGKALAIDPGFAEAHSNLGNALNALGRPDEAVESYGKAIAITPDFAEAHCNLGNAYQELGKPEEAVESYGNALAVRPDYADALYNLGMTQLLMGDFRNGWENFNNRWRCGNFAPGFQKYDQQQWQGGDLDGKRLLVWKEQGVGESIIFASMIPDLIEREADIILECDQRLVPLFSRSFPAVTCAAANGPDTGKAIDKAFDLHAPLGNAGQWLRADLAAFPARPSYLAADGGQREILRNRYIEKGNDFVAGITWHSKGSTFGERKSMTLDDLRPLLETPGITFVDLQYGDTVDERTAFTNETGIEVFHDDGVDQMADLDMFAAQVAAMDIVVTISNTTAHMAGALGVPALLMLGTVPIWYWFLERADSPWYPSLSLIRQNHRGDWRDSIARARDELAARAGDR